MAFNDEDSGGAGRHLGMIFFGGGSCSNSPDTLLGKKSKLIPHFPLIDFFCLLFFLSKGSSSTARFFYFVFLRETVAEVRNFNYSRHLVGPASIGTGKIRFSIPPPVSRKALVTCNGQAGEFCIFHRSFFRKTRAEQEGKILIIPSFSCVPRKLKNPIKEAPPLPPSLLKSVFLRSSVYFPFPPPPSSSPVSIAHTNHSLLLLSPYCENKKNPFATLDSPRIFPPSPRGLLFKNTFPRMGKWRGNIMSSPHRGFPQNECVHLMGKKKEGVEEEEEEVEERLSRS